MIISMIAAMSRNRVIGRDNDLPWHLPEDFAYFKEKTKGHHILMGRKNYESLPPRFRPLPDRVNMILTRNPDFAANGTQVYQNIHSAVSQAKNEGEKELFIIGGGQIFEMALSITNRIYLTEIEAQIDGDVLFPVFNKNEFREIDRQHHPTDDRHAYAFDFVIYEKQ